jgi:hypothetical protein
MNALGARSADSAQRRTSDQTERVEEMSGLDPGAIFSTTRALRSAWTKSRLTGRLLVPIEAI